MKDTKTTDLITNQDQEIKLIELEQTLKEREAVIEELKKEKELLRLHNQKLYSTRVVKEVEAEVEAEVVEERIDPADVRKLWSIK